MRNPLLRPLSRLITALALFSSWWASAAQPAAARAVDAPKPAAISSARPAAVAPAARVAVPTAKTSSATALTYTGKEFWVAFAPHGYPPGFFFSSKQSLDLYMAGDKAATGRISIKDSSFTPVEFTITPGQITTVTIPGELAGRWHSQVMPTGIGNKGILVTATEDIAVYGLNYVELVTDAFTAIPKASTGTDYYVAAYPSWFNGTQTTTVALLAQEDDTQITLTMQSETWTSANNGNSALSVFTYTSLVSATPEVRTFTLNAGQTYLWQPDNVNTDPSGTRVQSSKPVVVYGDAPSAKVPYNTNYGDALIETMPPVSSLGTRHVVVNMRNRTQGDTYRVYGTQNNTTVRVDGAVIGSVNQGQFLEYRTQVTTTRFITTDKPVMLQQYYNGTGWDSQTGDPSMVTVPSLEQGRTSYVFTTPQYRPKATGGIAEFTNTVNVVMPDVVGVDLYLDGVVVNSLSTLALAGVRAGSVPITPGAHIMTSTLPFQISVYGVRQDESYGYPGGANYVPLTDITSVSVGPESAWYPVPGGQKCISATVTGAGGTPIGDVAVAFFANDGRMVGAAAADASGVATLCYLGKDGDTSIRAVAGSVEDTAAVRWVGSPAMLVGLDIEPGDLAPTFISTTLDYTSVAPYSTTSTVVTPTLSDPSSTYTITGAPGTCTPANSPANCTLEVGVNTITVTVVMSNGSYSEYTIEIVRPAAPVELSSLGFDGYTRPAGLEDLVIAPASLSPAVAPSMGGVTYSLSPSPALTPGIREYTITIPYGPFQIARDASPTNTATLEMPDGTLITPGADGWSLPAGLTGTMTITTVTPGGDPSEVYTVNILREPAPETAPTTYYSATVPFTTASTVVTPTLADPTLSYTITGSPGPCTPGTSPSDCELQVGRNLITVTVYSNDVPVAVYVTEIIREPSSVSLDDLTIAPGTLAPAFVSTTNDYTATAPATTTSALVTATPTDPASTVTYTSSAGPCTAGAPAPGYDCAVAGPKTWITVTVTGPDGTTENEYYIEIEVAQPPSTDASLEDLTINPGRLAPSFVSTTNDYAATVPATTTSTLVTATPTDPDATVTYESSAGPCTVPGPRGVAYAGENCTVAGPKTWITVTVTAPDGTTTDQYFLEITVAPVGASDDASLTDLTIDPGTLAPDFVSTTKNYTTVLPVNTPSTLVTATPSDPAATVVYESSAGPCSAPSGGVAPSGENCAVAGPKTWITATVIAPDGLTTDQYFLEITFADTSLADLTIAPGTLAPAFVSTTNDYTATVPATTTSTLVTATPTDPAATVTYESSAGACTVGSLPPGYDCAVAGPKTWITVTVTASDTVTIDKYFIEIIFEMPQQHLMYLPVIHRQ